AGERVNFQDILRRVGARRGERIEVRRNRRMETRQLQPALKKMAPLDFLPIKIAANRGGDGCGSASAETNNRARGGTGGTRKRYNRVVEIGEFDLHRDYKNMPQPMWMAEPSLWHGLPTVPPDPTGGLRRYVRPSV